ncbi:hypothetical protein [Jannaschia pagri]|uniref:hypothetical protein n=1 Tax=Jannaschia TaxID=188905 RepID=UPI0035717935
MKTLLHDEGLTIRRAKEILHDRSKEPPAQVDTETLSDLTADGFILDLDDPLVRLIRVNDKSNTTTEIDLHSSDFLKQLASARLQAVGGEDRILNVTVLIPANQIRPIRFSATTNDIAHARSLAFQKLDGMTPYRLDEIEVSVHRDLQLNEVFVAAVAKETLQEAFDFCINNKFAPIQFASKRLGQDYPYHAEFSSESISRPQVTAPTDYDTETSTSPDTRQKSERPKEAETARVKVKQALEVQGRKLLCAEEGILGFNSAGLATAKESLREEIGSDGAMVLAALRSQLAQLQKEAVKRQLPEELLSRLTSYSVPLNYETPALILLDGPMAFLKGGLNDPYTTDALDGGFIGGWQKLCDLHDQFASCFNTTGVETDSELDLAEDFDIDEARDLTEQVLDSVGGPSVSEELVIVLQATRDAIEKASEGAIQRKGIVRRALTLIGSIAAFAATGTALHSWSVSVEGRIIIERLLPLVERFSALFAS